MSKPVKMEWCIIRWNGQRWFKHGKSSKSFNEHKEELRVTIEAAAIGAGIPAHHFKSIHTCWLDDIANWDAPEEFPGYGTNETVVVKCEPMTEQTIQESLERAKQSNDPMPKNMRQTARQTLMAKDTVIVHSGRRSGKKAIGAMINKMFTLGASEKTRKLDEEVAKLCPHDRREYRRYLKYLELRAKYGEKTLMARKFWRKYLGLE